MTAPLTVGVLDRVELDSPAILVSPTSARQARPSPEMRIFSYTKLSATYCWKRSWKSYSFEITVRKIDIM